MADNHDSKEERIWTLISVENDPEKPRTTRRRHLKTAAQSENVWKLPAFVHEDIWHVQLPSLADDERIDQYERHPLDSQIYSTPQFIIQPKRHYYSRLRFEDIAIIRSAYDNGLSIQEIVDDYSLPFEQVYAVAMFSPNDSNSEYNNSLLAERTGQLWYGMNEAEIRMVMTG